jgi:hypothetical protein
METARRLLEGDARLVADAEAVPVEDRLGAVLLDIHRAAGLDDRGLPGHDAPARGPTWRAPVPWPRPVRGQRGRQCGNDRLEAEMSVHEVF